MIDWNKIDSEFKNRFKGNIWIQLLPYSGSSIAQWGPITDEVEKFIHQSVSHAVEAALRECYDDVLKIKETKVEVFRDRDEYMRGYMNARIDALECIRMIMDELSPEIPSERK